MKISITKKLAGMVIAGSTAIFTMMPMSAFAQVPEEEAKVCICETKCDEGHINPKCPVCSYDYAYCEGKEPEVTETEDATETDAEKEEEPMGPLTPDGNLQLVDDYGSLVIGGAAGGYFYITKAKNKKPAKNSGVDPDADYNEDEEE